MKRIYVFTFLKHKKHHQSPLPTTMHGQRPISVHNYPMPESISFSPFFIGYPLISQKTWN